MKFKDKLALVQELESQRQKRQEEATALRVKLDEVSSDLRGACGLYYSIERLNDDTEFNAQIDAIIKELLHFELNETVHDDLTGKPATITNIDIDKNGNIGYTVNNEYLGGGRHPWELTKIAEDDTKGYYD